MKTVSVASYYRAREVVMGYHGAKQTGMIPCWEQVKTKAPLLTKDNPYDYGDQYMAAVQWEIDRLRQDIILFRGRRYLHPAWIWACRLQIMVWERELHRKGVWVPTDVR